MTKINVLYFGMFEEKTGRSNEIWETGNISLTEFEQMLLDKYPFLSQMSYQIAVNKQINSDKNIQLSENDEIAILPPFAGG